MPDLDLDPEIPRVEPIRTSRSQTPRPPTGVFAAFSAVRGCPDRPERSPADRGAGWKQPDVPAS
eukprot:6722372-Pyramimonas_sp.AAC.1